MHGLACVHFLWKTSCIACRGLKMPSCHLSRNIMLYQHTYWMFTEVLQSQTLTCLTMCSSVTRDAGTCVRIDSVRTSCSIHTRAAVAFVDIYKNNIKHVKIRKVNCINISVVQLHRISLRVIRDYTFLENDHAFEGEVNLSHIITPNTVRLCYWIQWHVYEL